MADYLSLTTYCQFLASAKSLSTDTNAIVCGKRVYKVKGLDLDSFHRIHRICTKHGLLKVTDRGTEIEYRLTPKGQALYDNYLMVYRKSL